MSWCKKRITNKELLVRFADNKHRFYLESVCGNSVKEGNLCNYCLSLTTQTKTQDVTTFPHGLVTGKYTDESHIYDSPWYHKKVGTYGPPTKECLELAMEAQKKARAGIRTKTIKDILQQIAVDEKPAEVVRESVEQKPSEKPAEKLAEIVPESIEQKPVQVAQRGRKPKSPENTATEKKIRKPSKKTDTPGITSTQNKSAEKSLEKIPADAQFVESMNDIVVVDSIVKVYLKTVSIGGVKYYKDTERDKLYSITAQKTVGKYIGRWDSTDDKIVKDAPDSDDDSCV
jgi:hypothetical protein